jgi:hypothetical protein
VADDGRELHRSHQAEDDDDEMRYTDDEASGDNRPLAGQHGGGELMVPAAEGCRM